MLGISVRQDATGARWWLSPIVAVVCFEAVTAALAPIGYHAMFTGGAPYDDEGSILISLKGFIADGGLYDQVFAQYGPFYFEALGGLFSLFDIEVSHDAGRFTTLSVWLITSLLSGVTVWRATGSVVLGLAAQLLAFRLLEALRLEPMHPSGLICLILVCLVAVTVLVYPGRPRLAMLLMGGFISALVLTKVNVGVFALASTALVCVATYPVLAQHRTLRWCVEAGFVLTPIVLVGADLSQGWAREFAVHVAITALALSIALRTLRPDPDRHQDELLWLVGGIGTTALVVCVAALVTGTTVGGLVNGVIVKPLGQSDAFSLPYALPPWAVPVDLTLLALCLGYRALAKRDHLDHPSWALLRVAISMTAAVLLVLTAANILFPAFQTSANPYELSALAVCWIALIPTLASTPLPAFALRFIPALAVLQALQAYPVAGSQVKSAALPLLFVAAVCAANGLRDLPSLLRSTQARRVTTAGSIVLAAVGTLSIANLVIVQGGRQAGQSYDARVPLNLPGAARVRMTVEEVELYRSVTEALDRRCRTFISLPGLNSFYLWTRQKPPTDLNVGAWMFLFDVETQRRVVDAVEHRPGICVLRNLSIAQGWSRGRDFPSGPLLSFTLEGLSPPERFGAFELATRRIR